MGFAALGLSDATLQAIAAALQGVVMASAWCRTFLPLYQPPLGKRLLVSTSSTYALRVGWQETVTYPHSGRRWCWDKARRKGSPPSTRP